MPDDTLKRVLAAAAVESTEAVDYARSGLHHRLRVSADQLVPLAQALKAEGFSLSVLSGVDYASGTDLVYLFNHHSTHLRLAAHLFTSHGGAVPTVAHVFASADWFEREVWEMFGVLFHGHTHLTWLVLTEGTEYRPLRKNFGKVHNVLDHPRDLGLAPAAAEAAR